MNPWTIYDELIDGVPDGIAVLDYCEGAHWSYVTAECGTGVAFTARGGAKVREGVDYRGRELKEMAALAKSWSFDEASLGVAALNSWYSRPELIYPLNPIREVKETLEDGTRIRRFDAFDLMKPKIEEAGGTAKVVIVGHFPHVERIGEYSDLTVLERNVRDSIDTPDPACEYVMPEADYAFITGVTFINKTAPRLLELAKDATTIMVGPSVVMTPKLYDHNVDVIAGAIVLDPERIAFTCKAGGVGIPFGSSLERVTIQKQD